MTIRNTLGVALTLSLTLAACSKKDAPQGAAGQAKPAEAQGAGLPAGELADFDLAGVAKKFDGKTFVLSGSLGKEVWSFAGGKVTIANGQTEETGDLEVATPCAVTVRMPEKNGIQAIKEKSFTWEGDTLHMGSGYGGIKQGEAFAACYGADTFIVKGDKCKLGGRGAPWAAATCKVEGGKLVTDTITYDIAGTALFDGSLKASVAELVPSLEAGKAKLASP